MAQTFEQTWDLDSLAPNPQTPEFQELVDEFVDDLRQLADVSDRLPPLARDHAVTWRSFLEAYQRVFARATALEAFVECHAAAEANNTTYQSWEARLAALAPLRERVQTNVELAVQTADSDALESLLAGDAQLNEIRFFFDDLRERAALRLPHEQELLSAELAVDGIHAWGRLYDRVSGALRIQVMRRGELVELSPGQVQFDSPERSVRENNFFAADRAWSGVADVCAEALNHIAGTRLTRYARLGIDHLEAPLRYNRMQRDTLQAMWSVVAERREVLRPYFEKKARLLGLKRLCWYDLQAPLGATPSAGTLSYNDACKMVIETFTQFSPDFGEFANMALQQQWVEVENRAGKRQGGFCTGFPTHQQSRIFMTFTESADSMSTLAHELGHAYHSHVLREQPLVLQDYPMNLAETASTFAEAVLGAERLRSAASSNERLQVLDAMLADAVAFLMNIHTRFVFENSFHTERLRGEVGTTRLRELMLAAQHECYLDLLDEQGWNANFWVSKLHFYISQLPFYNFPYTFGYLLSLGVYSLAQDGVEDFPERYRQLLMATGCCTTEDAVQSTFGDDLTQPDFWNRSLDIVEQRVHEFAALE